MRILLLSLYFEPDIGANAVIVSELAHELDRLGHQITVITSFPHYKGNVLEDSYRGKLIVKKQRENIHVIRTYIYTSPEKGRFLVRLLNYVSFNILSTLAGIFSGKQDLILAPSPPLSIGLSAAIIGFFKRIPYVYNVQDINPDVLIKLGILKNPLFIRFSKWLEKFVYQHARHITVLSEGFKRNLLKKGVPVKKISIVPNFVDPDFIKPLPRQNSFRKRFELEGKFIILYAGNLGHSQDLVQILKIAKLKQDDDKLAFVIVGGGSRKSFLKEKAKTLHLNNVRFIPFQPWEDVPLIYAAADVSLVTLKEDIALDSVPSKIYTIMASKRPVLAAVDQGSDAWKLIREAKCGICVEPDNDRALLDAISILRQSPELRNEMGKKGRNFVLKRYTRRVVGEKYHQLINGLRYGK